MRQSMQLVDIRSTQTKDSDRPQPRSLLDFRNRNEKLFKLRLLLFKFEAD